MAKTNLGKVVPQKGVDYFDGEDGLNATINGENAIELQGANDVKVINENGIVKINCVTPKKTSELQNDSNFANVNKNNNFSAAQTINGTLTVNGAIVQNGQTYETHAEKVFTKNDEIITRDGAVGGLSEGELTGIRAKLYDGANDGQLGFNADGTARVGDVGDTQPLLTRDEAENLQEGQVLVWDGEKLRAVGSSMFVKNTDYGTASMAGIVKVSDIYGIGIASNGIIQISRARNSEIDEKTNPFRAIVPANLNYAVRSVLPLTSDTLPLQFVAQTEYYLGTQSSITITPPTTAEAGQYTLINFIAETNIAVTINEAILGDVDFVFEAGNTYDILLTYNGSNWLMQVLEY